MQRLTGAAKVTRRRFLSYSGAAATGLVLGSRFSWAQQPAAGGDRLAAQRAAAATAKITIVPLRGGVSVLMGSGGNIAVLTGTAGRPQGEGKVLVDTGYASSRAQIAEALASMNNAPLTMLIDTHWHPDHTDGNLWMHAAGATIVAHQKTRDRLSVTQQVPAFGMTVPALPAGGLPTDTFTQSKTVQPNGTTLELRHYAPAHTDTDISISFVDADILHVGDTWFNGTYPFIDYGSGGNIDGMILAAEANLAATLGTTKIIPGHGPVGDKAALAEFHAMLVNCRDAVATLKKQGKPLPEVQAAKPTAAHDAKFGGGFMTPDVFTGLVYQGV